ncbi:MAG: AI-2E family transporter, partial [Patescibacteria group bacterium]|nr:AI-2E family transporter [Patescibacteria group bacterium]
AVLLGFLDGPTLGFMVIGLYVIIQQFENHLIYPLVVRKVVGVPPLLVILALIIGGQLAGFLGILLSAPIAAVIIEFTNDIQREKQKLSSHEK